MNIEYPIKPLLEFDPGFRKELCPNCTTSTRKIYLIPYNIEKYYDFNIYTSRESDLDIRWMCQTCGKYYYQV